MARSGVRARAQSRTATRRLEAELRRVAHLGFRTRRREERALAPKLDRHFTLLQRLALDQDVAVRRTVVEVLRFKARQSASARKLLLRWLGEESDAKTRRRICVALGESGDESLREQLLEALAQEKHRYVQASLILALGKLGLVEWPARWQSLCHTANTDKSACVGVPWHCMSKYHGSSI